MTKKKTASFWMKKADDLWRLVIRQVGCVAFSEVVTPAKLDKRAD
jgi:hypothetical protein